MLHIRRCALTRRTLWHQPHVSSSFLPKVIGKKRTVTRWRHNVTSDDLSTGNDATARRGYHSLSDYDSGWVGQIWCILEVPNFFIIDINHQSMGRSRNWHGLRSPISKIRNIQIVNTYVLTVHCEFQRVRITGVPLARCQTSKNATWGQVT